MLCYRSPDFGCACICVCLSLYLSICLSVCLSDGVSMYLCLCVRRETSWCMRHDVLPATRDQHASCTALQRGQPAIAAWVVPCVEGRRLVWSNAMLLSATTCIKCQASWSQSGWPHLPRPSASQPWPQTACICRASDYRPLATAFIHRNW